MWTNFSSGAYMLPLFDCAHGVEFRLPSCPPFVLFIQTCTPAIQLRVSQRSPTCLFVCLLQANFCLCVFLYESHTVWIGVREEKKRIMFCLWIVIETVAQSLQFYNAPVVDVESSGRHVVFKFWHFRSFMSWWEHFPLLPHCIFTPLTHFADETSAARCDETDLPRNATHQRSSTPRSSSANLPFLHFHSFISCLTLLLCNTHSHTHTHLTCPWIFESMTLLSALLYIWAHSALMAAFPPTCRVRRFSRCFEWMTPQK